MALNFPSSPTSGQLYSLNGKTWTWDGASWTGTDDSNPRSVVVADPVFLMQSEALTDTTVTLRASAQGLLTGVPAASLRLTKPDGSSAVYSVDANSTASTTFTISGSLGSSVTVKATAFDVLGNKSREVAYSVTVTDRYVAKADITAPLTGATEVFNGITISTSSFAAVGASDTLSYTEYQIRTGSLGTGTLLWTDTSSSATSILVPDDAVPAGSTAYIRARHVGAVIGAGQWSDDVVITMAATLPPSKYGDPYQGGFYAGQIKIGTNWYALVVAPKSQEFLSASCTSTALTPGLSTQAKSIEDGWSNTTDLVAYNVANSGVFFPAAQTCYDLTYAGFSDWYEPSIMELELAYRTLKPTSSVNVTSQAPETDINSGAVVGSTNENVTLWPGTTIPARMGNYINASGLASYPAITSSAAFVGVVQEGFAADTYWSSSAPTSDIVGRENMTMFDFSSGYVNGGGYNSGSAAYTTTVRYVRPFRRVWLWEEV